MEKSSVMMVLSFRVRVEIESAEISSSSSVRFKMLELEIVPSGMSPVLVET